MSSKTTKYKLHKIDLTDAPPDITVLNQNWDIIDEQMFNKNGDTMTGTLILSKVADTEGEVYNSPALVVGGEPNQAHLEFDNNEIQAKFSETTPGNLFLNSHGGKVGVGSGGLEIAQDGTVYPATKLNGSVGTAELPWNNLYGRYFNLYGDSTAQYGRFRVGTTGTTSAEGTATLELGNGTATGTAHNASGKITMYGSGTGFTNILPNAATSGSNSVTLPTATGTMAVFEASTSDLTAGSSALGTGKFYIVYE